jgi:hypothetical protein
LPTLFFGAKLFLKVVIPSLPQEAAYAHLRV